MLTEQAVSFWSPTLQLSLTFLAYAFPNDVQERERLSLQNEVLLRLFDGRLFFAPLNKKSPPKMILDVATGTGEWAIQMGDSFPHSQVIATDLSPIQPGEVPPNVNFYVEDSYVAHLSPELLMVLIKS